MGRGRDVNHLLRSRTREKIANAIDGSRREGRMIAEELLFDSDGDVDVEAMRDERETRHVPPNPPPPAAQPRWLDGKCIAQIAGF
jgi:hypothetical protein